MDEYIKREDALKAIQSVREVMSESMIRHRHVPDCVKSLCEEVIEASKKVINRIPPADVVPKSEVACELVGLYEKCASKIPHHIRRIFKDDRNFEDGFMEGKTDALIEVLALIAELKKKYTEESK